MVYQPDAFSLFYAYEGIKHTEKLPHHFLASYDVDSAFL